MRPQIRWRNQLPILQHNVIFVRYRWAVKSFIRRISTAESIRLYWPPLFRYDILWFPPSLPIFSPRKILNIRRRLTRNSVQKQQLLPMQVNRPPPWCPKIKSMQQHHLWSRRNRCLATRVMWFVTVSRCSISISLGKSIRLNLNRSV